MTQTLPPPTLYMVGYFTANGSAIMLHKVYTTHAAAQTAMQAIGNPGRMEFEVFKLTVERGDSQ